MEKNIIYMLRLPGSKSRYKDTGISEAGFLDGIWHGFIALITIFLSINKNEVRMYEVKNKGNIYDFGFFCGINLSYQLFMHFYNLLNNLFTR